jgi:hypothetical protein
MNRTVRSVLLATVVAMIGSMLALTTTAPAQAYARNCYAVRSAGETQSHGECYRLIKRISRDYKVGYRDSLVNRTSRTARLECEASSSRTFSYGASITIGASIKAGIFASIDASTSVSMSKSMTSGYAVKAGVSVPAHRTVYCDRVVYRSRFLVEKCYNYRGTIGSCKNFTFFAPAVRGWVLH